jgi:hypothetical protein
MGHSEPSTEPGPGDDWGRKHRQGAPHSSSVAVIITIMSSHDQVGSDADQISSCGRIRTRLDAGDVGPCNPLVVMLSGDGGVGKER